MSLNHRATVTLDALMVASQHGHAVRHLLARDLCVSAVGLLRMQYEAVLRAVWALFAATPSDLAALAAPLTPGTSKAAESLGMPGELLGAVDKSEATTDLKRTLREFRTSSWDFLNSYIHTGIHPLRRHEAHLEHELTTALRMSNGLAAITCGLMVIIGQQPRRQADINVVCIGWHQIEDFIEYVYGNDPSYQDPAKMLTWKGRAYLANYLTDLRALVAQELDPAVTYDLYADEF